jgi:Spy/CpxP family protein refolding chaperone
MPSNNNRQKKKGFLAGLLLAMSLALPVAAHAEPGGGGGREMREKVREKVKAYRIARLIEILNLDEKEATRLMPLVNKAYDEIAAVTKETADTRRELQDLMGAGTADDARMNTLIDKMLANRGKIERIEEDLIRDARKVLSANQVAKLVITLPEINHEIQQQIRRAARGERLNEDTVPRPGAPDDPQ